MKFFVTSRQFCHAVRCGAVRCEYDGCALVLGPLAFGALSVFFNVLRLGRAGVVIMPLYALDFKLCDILL